MLVSEPVRYGGDDVANGRMSDAAIVPHATTRVVNTHAVRRATVSQRSRGLDSLTRLGTIRPDVQESNAQAEPGLHHRISKVAVTAHMLPPSDPLDDVPSYEPERVAAPADVEDLLPQLVAAASRAVEAMEKDHYGLSDEQRQEIFYAQLRSSLARSGVVVSDLDGITASTSDPVVSTTEDDATASTTAEQQRDLDEAVHDSLTADQQAAYEEEWVDRDLWWTEIVGQLQTDEDVDVAASSSDSASSGESEASVTPDAHGGGNLFDLLGP
jgi:hypothetical protein